jgi:squalene-hopene/tetraprenyl-beta-curcumene cyclase
MRVLAEDFSIVGRVDSLHEPLESVSRDRHRQATRLRRAVTLTREHLRAQQHPDGYWVGELQGDTILESEYILLLAFLGELDTPIANKLGRYLLDQQLPGGGWAMYPDGPLEISGSVKAYFALKLVGEDPRSEPMQRARDAILAQGGADVVNSFTRFYLALLGQISYQQCPAVPAEAVLLPKWFPINLYAVSAWSRTMIVPLSIMSAHRPVRAIDPEKGIRELFLRQPDQWPRLQCPGHTDGGILSWDRFFRGCDWGVKFFERRGWLPLRQRALRAAERWILDRFDHSDGLGAIFPPMVWSTIALKCLGYDDQRPEIQYCRQQLTDLIIEEANSARLQPCKSPVWDTAITLRALAATGEDNRAASLRGGVEWLLSQQIKRPGDWSETVAAQPGGWCFEHANQFYPDVDDTIMAMMALGESMSATPLSADDPQAAGLRLVYAARHDDLATARDHADLFDRSASAVSSAEDWVLAMQNRDGGWGAFDRDNDREFLCHVPFADHNAMIDPSTPDLTGRVLEALAGRGRRLGDPVIDRAVAYCRQTQEADGSWFGRWGVNYIYGTWQVITGLVRAGVSPDDPAVTAAVQWLVAHQQADGGWGETVESYARPELRGRGATTPSQTAWALLGLLSAGAAEHESVQAGIDYLLRQQRPDGTWHEEEFTGTGFPRVFYLRYHMYPIYFPLLALAQYARMRQEHSDAAPVTKLGQSRN